MISKVDRVDAARLAEVEREARSLLAASGLADAPIYPVAATTGEGMAALRAHLTAVAGEATARPRDALFRLAVDRVFTLAGAGLVVTGTVHAGSVRVGDEIALAPAEKNVGKRARVRAIHALNAPAERGVAGERCSLNLAGEIRKADVRRGDWVVAPNLARSVLRFDAHLTLLANESKPLRHWSAVHCYLGAEAVLAHVAVLNEAQRIAPGERAFVQIVVERALFTVLGDRFVLRDPSATRTIAGGVALDPDPPTRKRRTPERLALLRALSVQHPGDRLSAVVGQSPVGLTRNRLSTHSGLASEQLLTLAVASDLHIVTLRDDELYITSARWAMLAAKLRGALEAFHRDQPDEAGLERDRLRRMALPHLDRDVYARLVDALIIAGQLAAAGPWLHLPAHRIQLTPQEQRFRDAVVPRIDQDAFDPPWMRDLARAERLDERTTRTYLKRLARTGELHQVVPDLFYSAQAIERLARIACDLA